MPNVADEARTEHGWAESPEREPRTLVVPEVAERARSVSDIDLLRAICEAPSVRGVARRVGLSPGSCHERITRLKSRGLVATNADVLVLTAAGGRELHAGSAGESRPFRTRVRTHGFAVQASIRRRPPVARFTGIAGWVAVPMRNWPVPKLTGTVILPEDIHVPVQVNAHDVRFFPPPVNGDIVDAHRMALDVAGKAARWLAEHGLEVGPLTFATPPEIAFVGHPFAVAFVRKRGTHGAPIEGVLWVDQSEGEPEVETADFFVALAILREPFTGGLDEWVARIVRVAEVLRGA